MIAFIFVVSVRIEKFLHLKRYRYFPPENQKREEVYINMRKFILKFKKKKKNISLSSNPMYGYKKSQLIVPPFNQQVLISKLIREKSLVINCCRKRNKEFFFLFYNFRKSEQ